MLSKNEFDLMLFVMYRELTEELGRVIPEFELYSPSRHGSCGMLDICDYCAKENAVTVNYDALYFKYPYMKHEDIRKMLMDRIRTMLIEMQD